MYMFTIWHIYIYIYIQCIKYIPFFLLSYTRYVGLGGDLAAPEQRGIVSAAMGVATSVGVASGDFPSVEVG